MLVTINNQIGKLSLWEKFVEMGTLRNKNKEVKSTATGATFYYYFRPIAIICRLLGVLPLKNLHDSSCKSLEFAYFSTPAAYTIFLFTVCIAVTFYFFDYANFLENASNLKPAFMWGCVVVALMIARALIYCFFCINRSKKYVKLIKLLDLFDREKVAKFRKSKIVENHTRLLLKKTIAPFLIGSFVTALTLVDFLTFCYFTILQINSEEFYTIWYASFAVLGLFQVMPLYLYVYFAFAVKENFKSIAKMCSESIPIRNQVYMKDGDHQSSTDVKDILRNVRVLYVLMADVVKNLNSSYGVFLAIDQFYVIVTFVVNFYVFFFTDKEDINLLYFVLVNGSVILVMVFVSHDINCEVSVIVK